MWFSSAAGQRGLAVGGEAASLGLGRPGGLRNPTRGDPETVGHPLLVEPRLARVEEGALVGRQELAGLGADALVGPAL